MNVTFKTTDSDLTYLGSAIFNEISRLKNCTDNKSFAIEALEKIWNQILDHYPE